MGGLAEMVQYQRCLIWPGCMNVCGLHELLLAVLNGIVIYLLAVPATHFVQVRRMDAVAKMGRARGLSAGAYQTTLACLRGVVLRPAVKCNCRLTEELPK